MEINRCAHQTQVFKINNTDDLAQARSLLPVEINTTKIPNSLMTPLWDSLGSVDRDLRKFSQNITESFVLDNFLNNKLYNRAPTFDFNIINWPLT